MRAILQEFYYRSRERGKESLGYEWQRNQNFVLDHSVEGSQLTEEILLVQNTRMFDFVRLPVIRSQTFCRG